MKTGSTVLERVMGVALLLVLSSVELVGGEPARAQRPMTAEAPTADAFVRPEDEEGCAGCEPSPDAEAQARTTAEQARRESQGAQLRARRLAEARARAGADYALSIRLNELGLSHHVAGRRPEAAAAFREAFVVAARVFGTGAPEPGVVLANLGTVISEMGGLTEGEAILARALELVERSEGGFEVELVGTLRNLALNLLAQRRDADAERVLTRGLALIDEAFETCEPEVAAVLEPWWLLLVRQGRHDDAEAIADWIRGIRTGLCVRC